ncbi:glutamine synthetase family protein [Anaeropeptidivorans aminofermentans]|uniref:glutamine synthetase family protein n=1 Tax=Anaeropeptidivorans aminofermentans TaxID=2934315 RepID=UPI002023BDA9|nr:glutamine synthetase family protein [Anaeropeptidivorans aminofermentans]
MSFTAYEALDFIRENDVRFISLAFCNLFGVEKNITLMAEELKNAFESGICVDMESVEGFDTEKDGDIFLFPDPKTLSILPWRPSQGRTVRFFCDMKRADGERCQEDARYLLKSAVKELSEAGYSCNIGCEYEFYIFLLDEYGNPTLIPQDGAGFCDISPLDKGEDIRREICTSLKEMGIDIESSHHERGPGQNEIVFKYNNALKAADDFITFRSVSEIIASKNGLHVSFLPKPLEHKNGSSMHVNLSLSENDINIFKTSRNEHNKIAESFMQGILDYLPQMTLFLNPLKSSYFRFNADIPSRLTWSYENRNELVRIPSAKGDQQRMELRSPDPSCNPYLAFYLLIKAGLKGIKEKSCLIRPEDYKGEILPETLKESVKIAEKSTFIKEVVPPAALRKFLEEKKKEYNL